MKKSISNIQRNSSPSLSMKGPTTPYRSTQMKATSFTAKQQGSTSASPWWTSSRNASGYLKECLRRHWKKRVKTRVSLASLGPPPKSFLPIHPTNCHSVHMPQAQHWCPVVHDMQLSFVLAPFVLVRLTAFGLPVSACWTLRLPFQQTTDRLLCPSSFLIFCSEFRSKRPSREPTKTDDLTWCFGIYWLI